MINIINAFFEYNVNEEYILFLIEQYNFEETKELIENSDDDIYLKILSINSIKFFLMKIMINLIVMNIVHLNIIWKNININIDINIDINGNEF